jgi:hypothetical protein
MQIFTHQTCKHYHGPILVLLTWQPIAYSKYVLTLLNFLSTCLHQYTGAFDTVPPVYWWCAMQLHPYIAVQPVCKEEMQTGSTNNPISRIFLMLAAPIKFSVQDG